MTRREEELTSQLRQCGQALLESRRENGLLRQKIDLLVKRVFGSSSEPFNPAQLELLPPQPESAAAVAVVAPEKERAGSPGKKRLARLPENLPVVEEVIDPEPVKAQPEKSPRQPGPRAACNCNDKRLHSRHSKIISRLC